jgi:receptor protein-tyrosine kinase
MSGLPVLTEIPVASTARKITRPLLPHELTIMGHEGYRALRTAIAIRGRGHPHAVLITGSMPSEGKTTSAINLAAALSQGGLRVILIEADLRRPRLAAAFGLGRGPGIEHVLAGQARFADALAPVAIDDARFNVLAAQGAGEKLADRLTPAAAKKLMNDARSLCDFVIVDSPPLTAVLDALPLAQLADDVLIVARLGRTKLSQLAALDEILVQHVRAPAGFVVIGESRTRRRARNQYYSSYIGNLETVADPDGLDVPSGSLPGESSERQERAEA